MSQSYKKSELLTDLQIWPFCEAIHTVRLSILGGITAFILKHDIQKIVHKIQSVEQLKRAVSASWGRISLQYVRNLYDGIPRRLKRVQVRKGHLSID